MKINKHLNILDFALRSITRRMPSHIAVSAGFAIVVFLAASLLFTIRSLMLEAENIVSLSPELTVQYLAAGRQVPIPLEITSEIRKIPGVRNVRPRAWGYLYDNVSGANYTLWGIMSEDVTRLEALGLTFEEGGFWRQGERGNIVVGAKLPESLGLGKIRSLTLTGPSGESKSFNITGLLGSPSSLLTADLILMDEKDVRDFFQMEEDFATDLTLEVSNPVEVPMIATKIYNSFPSCRVVSRTQMMRTYEGVFGYRGGFVLFAWLGCLVAFLILLWSKGSVLTPGELKEIGILKALGWSTAEVMEERIMESGIIAVFSFILGLAAAYVHVYVFGAALLKPILFGWSVLYPDFHLVPVWEGGPMALLIVLTVFPYIAASLLPAWRSAARETDELLRGGEA